MFLPNVIKIAGIAQNKPKKKPIAHITKGINAMNFSSSIKSALFIQAKPATKKPNPKM